MFAQVLINLPLDSGANRTHFLTLFPSSIKYLVLMGAGIRKSLYFFRELGRGFRIQSEQPGAL